MPIVVGNPEIASRASSAYSLAVSIEVAISFPLTTNERAKSRSSVLSGAPSSYLTGSFVLIILMTGNV